MNQPDGTPFTDATLVAYLDDVLDPAERRAVEASAEASVRLTELRAELNGLAQAGARALCPGSETLADFLAGELPDGEERRLGAHVAWCRACGDELVEMRVFYRAIAADLAGELDAEPAPGRRSWLVLRQDGALGGGSLGRRQPAVAALAGPSGGLRGAGDQRLTFAVEGLTIDVTIAADQADPSLRTLTALVARTAEADDAPLDLTAELIAESGDSRAQDLDALGEATFEGLQPGDYSVLLTRDGVRILLPGLTI